MEQQSFIKLHDGNSIPQLGLGVWQVSNKEAQFAVSKALATGYRLIDTAAIYKNEEGVGRAIRLANISRKDLFITTKLWNRDQKNPQKALEISLKKLQLDYVDLYLIHWPDPKQNRYVDAWRAIVTLKEQKLTRSIGVCNFHISHLQHLLDENLIAPTVNQIELHPMLQQRLLYAWNATHNIATESASPLAQGGHGIFDHAIIIQLAKKYCKTAAQIVIRWHLDSGLIVIPKSITASRIREHFQVFDFKLDKEELCAIVHLDIGKRLGPNPETF